VRDESVAADVTDTPHRIDPATVRREVEAVDFVFDSESKILANPADPRTTAVFDKSSAAIPTSSSTNSSSRSVSAPGAARYEPWQSLC
jgi:predicted methyltransferase